MEVTTTAVGGTPSAVAMAMAQELKAAEEKTEAGSTPAGGGRGRLAVTIKAVLARVAAGVGAAATAGAAARGATALAASSALA